MQFKEALDLLKAGECMHRTGWEPQDGYIVLMKGMKHVWKIILQPAPNAGNYIFSMEDLCSEDWQKFEEAQSPVVIEQAPEAA